MDSELTPIEFIAQMINHQKSKQEGYASSVRWLSLRDDLKAKYKTEAQQMFEEWRDGEMIAKEQRDNIMKGVVIKQYGD